MGLSSLGIFSSALDDWVRYALCLTFSFLAGLIPPSLFGGVAVHAPGPRQIGAANGILNQGSNLGQFLGPPAVAALVSLTGQWQSASGVLVAAACVAGVAGVAGVAATRWEPSANPSHRNVGVR